MPAPEQQRPDIDAEQRRVDRLDGALDGTVGESADAHATYIDSVNKAQARIRQLRTHLATLKDAKKDGWKELEKTVDDEERKLHDALRAVTRPEDVRKAKETIEARIAQMFDRLDAAHPESAADAHDARATLEKHADAFHRASAAVLVVQRDIQEATAALAADAKDYKGQWFQNKTSEGIIRQRVDRIGRLEKRLEEARTALGKTAAEYVAAEIAVLKADAQAAFDRGDADVGNRTLLKIWEKHGANLNLKEMDPELWGRMGSAIGDLKRDSKLSAFEEKFFGNDASYDDKLKTAVDEHQSFEKQAATDVDVVDQLKSGGSVTYENYALPERTRYYTSIYGGYRTITTQNGETIRGVGFDNAALAIINNNPKGVVFLKKPFSIQLSSQGAIERASYVDAKDLAYGRLEDDGKTLVITDPTSGKAIRRSDVGALEKGRDERVNDVLRCVDRDPAMAKILANASDVHRGCTKVQSLFAGGAEGGKYEQFVEFSRNGANDLSAILNDPDTLRNALAARSKLQELKRAEMGIAHSALEAELDARIKALDGFIDTIRNPQLRAAIDTMRDKSKWSADTWANWVKKEGPQILVAIALAVAATAAVILTCGGASPLALAMMSAAAGTAGGMAGAELTKEIQHAVAQYDADIAAGKATYTERSKIGAYVEGQKVRGADGVERSMDFLGDVVSPYAQEFAVGFVTTLGTMGAANAAGGAISRFLQNPRVLAALSKHGPTLNKIILRMQRLEQASNEATQKTIKAFASKVTAEFGDELKDEALENAADRFLTVVEASLTQAEQGIGLGELGGFLVGTIKNIRFTKPGIMTYRANPGVPHWTVATELKASLERGGYAVSVDAANPAVLFATRGNETFTLQPDTTDATPAGTEADARTDGGKPESPTPEEVRAVLSKTNPAILAKILEENHDGELDKQMQNAEREFINDPQLWADYKAIMIDGDYDALKKRSEGRLKKLQTAYFGSETAPPESDVEGKRTRAEKNAKLDSFRTFVQGLVPIRNDSRQDELAEFKSPRETGTKNSMGAGDLIVQADRYVYASYDDMAHPMSGGGVAIADASVRGRAEIVMLDGKNIGFRADNRGGNPYIRSYMDNTFDYETGQEILATYLASVFDTPEQARIFLSYNTDSRTSEEWDTALSGEITMGKKVIVSKERSEEIATKIKEIYATMGFEPPLSLEVRIPDSATVDRSRMTGEQRRTRDFILSLPDTPAGYEKREGYASDVTGIRKLSATQKKAVRDAHDVKMAGDKYSPAELKQKMEILEAGGFTRDQADSLLRMGVCGSPSSMADVDYPALHLEGAPTDGDTFLRDNSENVPVKPENSGEPRRYEIDPNFFFGPHLEQLNVGNCYLIASFHGMQQHPRFDDMMRRSISQLGDGSYEVSFPLGSESPAQTIVVTEQDMEAQAKNDDARGELQPVAAFIGWRVLEAAYLKLHTGRSDRAAMEGGTPHVALQEMLGDAVTPVVLSTAQTFAEAQKFGDIPAELSTAQAESYARKQMFEFFDGFDPARHIATLGSKLADVSGEERQDHSTYEAESADGTEQLFYGHAYSIESIDKTNRRVTIKNPHDTSQAIIFTYEQAFREFGMVSGVAFKTETETLQDRARRAEYVSQLKDYLKAVDVEDATRVSFAEIVLGRGLLPEENVAILTAHRLPGAIDALTPAETVAKGRALLAVFSKAEAKLLMDSGICGTPAPGDPSAAKPAIPKWIADGLAELQKSGRAAQPRKGPPPPPPPPGKRQETPDGQRPTTSNDRANQPNVAPRRGPPPPPPPSRQKSDNPEARLEVTQRSLQEFGMLRDMARDGYAPVRTALGKAKYSELSTPKAAATYEALARDMQSKRSAAGAVDALPYDGASLNGYLETVGRESKNGTFVGEGYNAGVNIRYGRGLSADIQNTGAMTVWIKYHAPQTREVFAIVDQGLAGSNSEMKFNKDSYKDGQGEMVLYIDPKDTATIDRLMKTLDANREILDRTLMPTNYAMVLRQAHLPLYPGITMVERSNGRSWDTLMTSTFQEDTFIGQAQRMTREVLPPAEWRIAHRLSPLERVRRHSNMPALRSDLGY